MVIGILRGVVCSVALFAVAMSSLIGSDARGEGARPEARVRPEAVVRAEALREVYRSSPKAVRIEIESRFKGDSEALKFLRGEAKTLSAERLPQFSEAYVDVSARVEGARMQLTDAFRNLGENAGETRRTLLKEMAGSLGVTPEQLGRAVRGEAHQSQGLARIKGLSATAVSELLKEGGPWEAYFRRVTEIKAQDATTHENTLVRLAEVHRDASLLAESRNEGERLAGQAMQSILRRVGGDPGLVEELHGVMKTLNSGPEAERAASQRAVRGLEVVEHLGGYAKDLANPAQSRLDAARTLLHVERLSGEARVAAEKTALEIAKKLEARENAQLPEILKALLEIAESSTGSTKRLLKKLGLGEAKTMDELLAKLEKGVRENEGTEGNEALREKLNELRDYLSARRLMLALSEPARWKQSTMEAKIRIAQCALRAANLRSPMAKAGALAGLCLLLGIKSDSPKLANFDVPGKLFAKDAVGYASAERGEDTHTGPTTARKK